MKNRDTPAMPVSSAYIWELENGDESKRLAIGLTKREHFAGLAMQSMILDPSEALVGFDDVAEEAVKHADALLEALEKNYAER